MSVDKYTKNPVEVEADQFDGSPDRADEIVEWILHGGGRAHVETEASGGLVIIVGTLEGNMRADADWWIIRGSVGEFYPCRDDIFRATYTKV